ncbi:hypothetical protein [Methanobrevibacter sp.]|uniref:hypothetical protein n=1 Tax=Methanobrevibacter sp. TaxID=66852 RepID=UPI00388FA1E0
MEKYEVLEDIRCLQKETLAFGNTMKSWMSNDEIEDFNKLKKLFNIMVSSYEEECLDNDICPNCGGEVITKTIYDDEVGAITVVKCMDCQTNFD